MVTDNRVAKSGTVGRLFKSKGGLTIPSEHHSLLTPHVPSSL